ncbi:MAG TPA: RsmD family RNA methyltransferase, partial [Kiritimatiellia bacterium]|nr:RsmD family RNA methyltransferase [Kiritimatiellia bacterium]
MRLTGGEQSGRRLRVPAGGLRPTQDRVREALCSSLAAYFPEARVLDLFAGTGAMGLEAWSRGAAQVEWVESSKAVLRDLRANVAACGVPPEAGRVTAADVFQRLAHPCPGKGHDLVLADPPYQQAREEGWLEKLAILLAKGGWIKPGGVWGYET